TLFAACAATATGTLPPLAPGIGRALRIVFEVAAGIFSALAAGFRGKIFSRITRISHDISPFLVVCPLPIDSKGQSSEFKYIVAIPAARGTGANAPCRQECPALQTLLH